MYIMYLERMYLVLKTTECFLWFCMSVIYKHGIDMAK